MRRADKIGALLREAFQAGETEGKDDERYRYGFEAWLADNGDEILAAVAELAQGVRAQEAAKVRALGSSADRYYAWRARRMDPAGTEMARPYLLNALARDIEDGTL